MKRTINICGVTYQIRRETNADDKRLVNSYGYCDHFGKLIVIDRDLSYERHNLTLRHEITHAVLWECGLQDYCHDETLVTFLETQLPKLFDICRQLDILEE